MPERVHLLTGSPCTHAVSGPFCPVCGTAESRPEAITDPAALAACVAAIRSASVVLRGGDVLQRPDALDVLAVARSAHRRTVEVWTAGAGLARPGAAEALKAAGATGVAVPLHGVDATAHDWCCGRDGDQKRTLAAIKRALAAGLQVTVLATVLRPTYRGLVPLARTALALPIAGIRFVAVAAPDRPAHPLSPPPVLAGAHVAAACRIVRAARRKVAVDGLPPCVLGEAGALGLVQEPVQVVPGLAPPPPNAYGKPCEACTWRAACPGMAAAIALQHGWTGVDARTEPLPGRSGAEESAVLSRN